MKTVEQMIREYARVALAPYSGTFPASVSIERDSLLPNRLGVSIRLTKEAFDGQRHRTFTRWSKALRRIAEMRGCCLGSMSIREPAR